MGTKESSNRSGSTKPWASGRVLTPSQRERKRYRDRVSKREKQEKESETLKHLQSQVAALQDALQSHSRLVPGMLPVAMSPDESMSSCLLPPSSLDEHLTEQSCTVVASRSAAAPFDSQTPSPLRKLPGSWENHWPRIPPSLQPSDSYAILEFADKVLRKPSELSILDICSDGQLNQDAIIRGVLEGWHFMEDRTYSCPLWRIISQIDELIFMQSGILTRLAMLSTILKMLMAVVYENNFGQIPSWYRPRPSQLNFPHRVTADYFAWPGFRERLVLSNCEILTDRFFKYFASCFRLSWPHPISNAYKVDPETELYSFSEAFSVHLVDLSRWTMCKPFFSSFPSLEEDMLPENQISSSYFTLAPDNPLSMLSV